MVFRLWFLDWHYHLMLVRNRLGLLLEFTPTLPHIGKARSLFAFVIVAKSIGTKGDITVIKFLISQESFSADKAVCCFVLIIYSQFTSILNDTSIPNDLAIISYALICPLMYGAFASPSLSL